MANANWVNDRQAFNEDIESLRQQIASPRFGEVAINKWQEQGGSFAVCWALKQLDHIEEASDGEYSLDELGRASEDLNGTYKDNTKLFNDAIEFRKILLEELADEHLHTLSATVAALATGNMKEYERLVELADKSPALVVQAAQAMIAQAEGTY